MALWHFSRHDSLLKTLETKHFSVSILEIVILISQKNVSVLMFCPDYLIDTI